MRLPDIAKRQEIVLWFSGATIFTEPDIDVEQT